MTNFLLFASQILKVIVGFWRPQSLILSSQIVPVSGKNPGYVKNHQLSWKRALINLLGRYLPKHCMPISIQVENNKGWNLKDRQGGKVEEKSSVRLSSVSVWVVVKLSQRLNNAMMQLRVSENLKLTRSLMIEMSQQQKSKIYVAAGVNFKRSMLSKRDQSESKSG